MPRASKRAHKSAPKGLSSIEIGLIHLGKTEPTFSAWQSRYCLQFPSATIDTLAIWGSLPQAIAKLPDGDESKSNLMDKWQSIEAARTNLPTTSSSPTGIADKEPSDNGKSRIWNLISNHPLMSILLLGGAIGWIESPFGWFFPILFLLLFVFSIHHSRKNKRFRKSFLVAVFIFGFIGTGIAHDVYFDETPTAECRDGSYSFSAHHRGTCSWHGGVSVWNPSLHHWWQDLISLSQ